MTRTIASALLTIIAAAAPAHAQDGDAPDWANKSGAIGVGANTTLGGVTGINVRPYVTPQFGLALTLGFNMLSAQDEDVGTTSESDITSLGFGAYGTYQLAYWQRGSLGALLGVDLVSLGEKRVTAGITDADDSGLSVLAGLGLQGEYFPTQYLSLFASCGLQIDFLSEDATSGSGASEVTTETTGLSVDLGSDLMGAAGFTVWFK